MNPRPSHTFTHQEEEKYSGDGQKKRIHPKKIKLNWIAYREIERKPEREREREREVGREGKKNE